MAHTGPFSHLLARGHVRQGSTPPEQEWTEREVYRARTSDASFASFDELCETCGEVHRNPYEGSPHYVTMKVPVRVATNWARHHGIAVEVEQRMAYVHKKAGRPDRVQLVPYTDWMTIRTIGP